MNASRLRMQGPPVLTRQRFYRGLCVLCGLLGLGIYVQALCLGSWLIYIGIATLLIGLVTASFVVRRW
jgi:hypothetical protein